MKYLEQKIEYPDMKMSYIFVPVSMIWHARLLGSYISWGLGERVVLFPKPEGEGQCEGSVTARLLSY